MNFIIRSLSIHIPNKYTYSAFIITLQIILLKCVVFYLTENKFNNVFLKMIRKAQRNCSLISHFSLNTFECNAFIPLRLSFLFKLSSSFFVVRIVVVRKMISS